MASTNFDRLDKHDPESLKRLQYQAILYSVQGDSWEKIAKKLTIAPVKLLEWRRDARFRAALGAVQEVIFTETANMHKFYVESGFSVLNMMAQNEEGKYSEKTQLEAAIKLIELTHSNINVVKLLEQNRMVIEEYLGTDYYGSNQPLLEVR